MIYLSTARITGHSSIDTLNEVIIVQTQLKDVLMEFRSVDTMLTIIVIMIGVFYVVGFIHLLNS